MADKGNLKLGRRDFLRVAGLGAGAAAVATVADQRQSKPRRQAASSQTGPDGPTARGGCAP